MKIKDIWYYIQGHVRYYLYYKCNFLLSLHIKQQIDARIKSMNQQCYNQGSCIKCGCKTTHLQMANKNCEGLCYPSMQNRKNWNLLKNKKIIISNKKAWQLNNSKFKQFDV